MVIKKRKQPRRGVILLIALGMLALFGILTAAFLTFASSSRQAAFSSARKQFRSPKPEDLMHEAFMQILRGTQDRNSALFRHDLLGDYYGYHAYDANVATAMGTAPGLSESYLVRPLRLVQGDPRMPRDRGVLRVGGGIIKVPVQFDVVQPVGATAHTDWPENIHNTTTFSSPLNLDDALAGRTVSFLDGPLAGHTVRIVRWAGHRTFPTGGPPPMTDPYFYRYSMFLDLTDPSLPSTVVLGDGTIQKLEDILNPTSGSAYLAACLFYNPGADGIYGGGAVAQAGWPGSDDVPVRMVINPAPRNGSGSGVHPITGVTQTLTSTLGSQILELPVSLQPNYSRWWDGTSTLAGNADEPYDAPDYENMFLSSVQGGDGFDTRIIPSFHRPAMINYLLNVNGYNLSSPTAEQIQLTAEAIRRATLRPLPFHETQRFGATPAGSHPNFTGGNAAFILRTPIRLNQQDDAMRLHLLANALINGPWDVDNDGDGIPDSIWIDANLPVVTMPDGTVVRPLIAVQIEDLGSKFDLNAHGNPAQLTDAFLSRGNGPLAGKLTGTDMSTAASLPSGRGFGPAEIFPLLDTASISTGNTNDPRYGRLTPGTTLHTALDRLFAGRYAPTSGAEVPTWTVTGTVPEWQNPPQNQPGIRRMVPGTVANDAHDELLRPGRPQIHGRSTRFGFPIDPFGRGGWGIDASGNLLSSAASWPLLFNPNDGQSYMDESLNDPYEFDPSGRLTGDQAYRLSELGGLLNMDSWDQHLTTSRLRTALADAITADPSIAGIVTTYSSSEVRPSPMRLPELRDEADARVQPTVDQVDPTLVESLMARIFEGGTVQRPIDEADLIMATAILAPELRMGMPINLNRPFGNGINDNGDAFGMIDEASEVAAETSFGGQSVVPTYNVSPDPSIPAQLPFDQGPYYAPETARQALARHLYCAAMLLINDEDTRDYWISDTTHISGGDVEKYRARRIAQWAVNVVDYRDSDGAMTRFVYDENPLDGWDINPASNAGQIATVWGCEHPELVFMESLAFHDLRVKDTSNDSSGSTIDDGDPHVDQIRIPQGSAFLELFAPRPRTTVAQAVGGVQASAHEAVPAELYDTSGTEPLLDLARMAPGRDLNGDGDWDDADEMRPVPVWRIAISEPHILDKEPSPLAQREEFTDTTSFEPAAPDELGLSDAPAPLALERFVVFNYHERRLDVEPLAAIYGVDPGAIFSNLTNGPVGLPLGTYLTVAPRTETRLGSLADNGIPTSPSPQRIEAISGDGIVHYDRADNRLTPTFFPTDANADVRQSMVFYAQAFEPPAWGILNATNRTQLFGPGNVGIGFNISEPIPGTAPGSYYRMPENYLMGTTGDFPRRDAYWDYQAGESEGNIPPSDEPVDLNDQYPIGELTLAYTTTPPADTPFLGHEPNYRTAYLQRLADPTLPYQNDLNLPNYNPYRTVDWISMDLTVFSGDEAEDKIVEDARYIVESRQRTGESREGNTPQNLLFANRLSEPTPQELPPVVLGQPYFNLDLLESLSFLNPGFGVRHNPSTVTADSTVYADYIGQPQTPFALHPWLNRPYNSPLELMFVPATSQGRLFEEFSIAATGNLYEGDDRDEFYSPFGHLLNFFATSRDTDQRTDLYRIFDLLSTGPKFRGSVDPLSSSITSSNLGITTPGGASAARDFWRRMMAFPFSQFPSFREQGRLNLNTVGDQRVYAGLMWGHLPATERAALGSNVWPNFAAARRGYDPHGGTSYVAGGSPPYNYAAHLHPKYPTEFAAKFTASLASDLAPELDANGGSDENRLRKPAVTSTLLRPAPDGAGDGFASDAPLLARTDTDAHTNADRSSIMRYQSMTRLSNLTTDHSNAYLVRITLGFFVVDPSTGALGREHLSDLGRSKRYRATYVVDRSIPCHYVPGEDHDTERLILFRRFHEE